jgi:hypothetical protein
MLPNLGEEEVLIIRRITPVGLLMRRSRRSGGGRRRWRRAGEYVGCRSRHARRRWPSHLPLLLRGFIQPGVQDHARRIQTQLLAQYTASAFRETYRPLIASHDYPERVILKDTSPRCRCSTRVSTKYGVKVPAASQTGASQCYIRV